MAHFLEKCKKNGYFHFGNTHENYEQKTRSDTSSLPLLLQYMVDELSNSISHADARKRRQSVTGCKSCLNTHAPSVAKT